MWPDCLVSVRRVIESCEWSVIQEGWPESRVAVQGDDVFEFLGKFRIVRQLERTDAMRRELVGFENTLHRAQAHSRGFRQHPAGPVGCFSRRRSERQVDYSLHGAGRQRWYAGLARLVTRQPFDAPPPDPTPPSP